MTSAPPPPTRSLLSFTLPRHAWLMVAGGFALGLLLFVLAQSLGRDKTFYRGQGEAVSDPQVQLAPLPTPIAAGGSMDLQAAARPEGGDRPHLVEPPAPPAPEPEPVVDAGNLPPPDDVASAPTAAVDAPPQRIAEQSPPPEYPASALRRGRSGVVVLTVQVDATGRPARVRVSQRSGTRELDRAAVDAVQRWRFRPAMAGGQPVPGEVEVPIEFSP